jgi:hypothetical protein
MSGLSEASAAGLKSLVDWRGDICPHDSIQHCHER